MDKYGIALIRLQNLAIHIKDEMRVIEPMFINECSYSIERDIARLQDVANDIITDTNTDLVEMIKTD